MTKQNARREEVRKQMFELFNEKVKTPRTVFSKFSVICGRVFFTNLYSGEDFVADFRDTDEPRIYVFDSGKEYPVTWSTFGDDVLAVCRRLWALFEEVRALETVEDKQTQLDEVREEIKGLSREIGDYTLFTHCTSTYLYAGFHFADENGVIEFRREGKKVRAIPTSLTTFVTSAGDNFPSYRDVPSFKQLPRTVRELIIRMSVIRSRLLNCQAMEQALTEAIKEAEEEEAGAPVEELEEYDVCTAIHTKTLAQRVRERCQMEAGELPPYTPDSMPVCDRDLIEDINDALNEIDASGVNELLKYADDSENEGRKAKAAGYRQVAQLAALYAINDAIEEQPELEELLSELLDWDKPAQLPANIAAGISESFAAARRVFDISDLAPDDLSERSRLWAADTWAIEVDYYRGMDDDLIKAFAIHAGAGLWIQYFKQTWMFINDGVVNASCGSFEEQATSFVAILSRYLAPDVEDLY